MGDLSKNISRHEVACHCGCRYDTIDFETVNVVQDCCDHFAKELGQESVYLKIYSGARCVTWNKAVKGASSSQHIFARAMDISIKGVIPSKVYEYFDNKYPNTYGIGNYKSFTHIDTRAIKARW